MALIQNVGQILWNNKKKVLFTGVAAAASVVMF
uniref:ABC transporter permease n=1 Tax=Bursaphelenchus xylophilus TaxID=6326 RepID=A0A1I7SIR6_BURXY